MCDYVAAAAVYRVPCCAYSRATNRGQLPGAGVTTITLTGSSFSASSLSAATRFIRLSQFRVLVVLTAGETGFMRQPPSAFPQAVSSPSQCNNCSSPDSRDPCRH